MPEGRMFFERMSATNASRMSFGRMSVTIYSHLFFQVEEFSFFVLFSLVGIVGREQGTFKCAVFG